MKDENEIIIFLIMKQLENSIEIIKSYSRIQKLFHIKF